MVDPQTNAPTPIHLDRSIWNRDLYTKVLQTFLASYPTPTSLPGPEDVKRWFGAGASPAEKAAFDEQCRTVCMPALESIGPDRVPLPPYADPETERRLEDVCASCFEAEYRLGSGDQGSELHAPECQDAALAIVILLDQMTRNCFRAEAQGVVYAHYDRISRGVARAVVRLGFDRIARWEASLSWRPWFYMPWMHSESLADHELWMEKAREQLDAAQRRGQPELVAYIEKQIAFEEGHVQPLREFGRYPWRNKWLGRENTPAERRYLEEGGKTFGTS